MEAARVCGVYLLSGPETRKLALQLCNIICTCARGAGRTHTGHMWNIFTRHTNSRMSAQRQSILKYVRAQL